MSSRQSTHAASQDPVFCTALRGSVRACTSFADSDAVLIASWSSTMAEVEFARVALLLAAYTLPRVESLAGLLPGSMREAVGPIQAKSSVWGANQAYLVGKAANPLLAWAAKDCRSADHVPPMDMGSRQGWKVVGAMQAVGLRTSIWVVRCARSSTQKPTLQATV